MASDPALGKAGSSSDSLLSLFLTRYGIIEEYRSWDDYWDYLCTGTSLAQYSSLRSNLIEHIMPRRYLSRPR